jgi:hypothetical protein
VTYNEINSMAKRLPLAALPEANRRQCFIASDELPPSGFDDFTISCFLHGYNDLSFGWRAALALADGEEDFPIYPAGRTHWVWMAWRLLQNRRDNAHKQVFRPVMDAFTIHTSAAGRSTREVLGSLLLASDSTIAEVAKLTGLKPDVVDAYDALFYNVTDRRDDFMYLRNIAYPNTRMEEMLPGYLEKGNLAQIMLRQGYNSTVKESAYLAGFRTECGGDLTYAQAAEAYQTELMRIGLLLVKNGFLHHFKQHPAIGASRALVVAGKIGGQETTGGEASGNMSSAFANQFAADADQIRAELDRNHG